MLPSEAHLSLCICHVFSSTIGLVNILCRNLACVKTVLRNISRMHEQISKHRGYRNAHAVSTLTCLLLQLIVGLFYPCTDSFVERFMAREVRCWVTDRQTHMTTTVTLAAHVRQGLRENGFFDNRYASTLLFARRSARCVSYGKTDGRTVTLAAHARRELIICLIRRQQYCVMGSESVSIVTICS